MGLPVAVQVTPLAWLPVLHLSFVCTGNICRSPMAELVVREHLARAGLADAVRVSSAGTGSWHVGAAADPRTIQTLRRAGYPTEHVAAQVGPQHLDADLLITMDSGHLSALRRLVDDPDRVRLLRSFDPELPDGTDAEVPDPYYGDRGFQEVLRMVHAAVPGLLAWVRDRL